MPHPDLIPSPPVLWQRRPERLAWIAVGGWTTLIYATIPFARQLESFVGGLLGGADRFLMIGVGAMLVGLAWTAIRLVRSRRFRSRSQVLWLLAVAAAFVGYATRLDSPVEALHYIEYAVLSLLVFRALGHRRRDTGVYLVAVLVCGILGTIDELIQWVTPERFADLPDIRLNFIAALLVQIAIWKGVAPPAIERRWDRGTLRLAILLAAVWTTLLGLWISTTPSRLAAAARHLPAVAFLRDNPSVLAEYGHRHTEPEIGVVYSRFTLDELAAIDHERGPNVAAILDEFADPVTYPRFLSEYNSATAPFVHEARVHIYRRNRHRERVAAAEPGSHRQRGVATIAWRENRILERHFAVTLAASQHQLTPSEQARLETLALPEMAYESGVSRHLITAVTERQLRWAALALLLALALAYRKLPPH